MFLINRIETATIKLCHYSIVITSLVFPSISIHYSESPQHWTVLGAARRGGVAGRWISNAVALPPLLPTHAGPIRLTVLTHNLKHKLKLVIFILQDDNFKICLSDIKRN